MINKLIKFLKQLFEENNTTTYPKEVVLPSSSNNNTKINSSSQKKIKSKSQNNNSIKYDSQNQNINKSVLMKKIKRNIIFLDHLMEALSEEVGYRNYYKKIKEMKIQSEGCFKIVHRIKEEAPYKNSTLKMILNHTNTVAKLLHIKK